MKLVFVILLVLAICVAAVGIAYILPGKKRTSDTPQADLLSPDSMVKVTPAGPGRLRMSIPQGDRMPMEVMLQITEIKEETDLDKLKDPKRTPEEKQEIVNRLRSMGYEIAFDPSPRKQKVEQEPYEPVTVIDMEEEAPHDMTSD